MSSIISPPKGYRRVSIKGVCYFAHRLIWLYCKGNWPKGEIDHISGCRDDNRMVNLRDTSRQQNAFNMRRHSDGASGFKGVHYQPQYGTWRARIYPGGRQVNLGSFGTSQEAHAAYCAAAEKYFGKFARAG